MPFGVRGVRPGTDSLDRCKIGTIVSNAFRREGRSPPLEAERARKAQIAVSNAFRREGRSPRQTSKA